MIRAPDPDLAPGCLPEETIAAFISGDLDAAAVADVDSHVSSCATCRCIVADAAHGALERTGARERAATRPARAAVSAALQHPAAEPQIGSTTAPTVADRTTWRPGEVIAGKFRIERVLGRGGMGVVLAARHVDLRHRVAVKVLHDCSEESVARFFREARLSARLNSERVPRIFDFGRLPDGTAYLVMECLEGRDLAQIAAEGPLPVVDAVRYVIGAAMALADAHAAGIVHRDLKPANLFVVNESPGPGERVKVLDFGICKLIEGAGVVEEETFGLTSTGAALGSPRYMSPEQIRAQKDVDRRTDIWSLGVILYQLLTGEVPFSSPTLPALAVAIATETPTAPTIKRPGLPSGLEAAVLRCLEKKREARFDSVQALAQALSTFTADPRRLPAEILPAGSTRIPPERGGAPARRRVRAAIAMAVVAAVGAVAVWTFVAKPAHTGEAHPRPSPVGGGESARPRSLAKEAGVGGGARSGPAPAETAAAIAPAPLPESSRVLAPDLATSRNRNARPRTSRPASFVRANPASPPVAAPGPLETPD